MGKAGNPTGMTIQRGHEQGKGHSGPSLQLGEGI